MISCRKPLEYLPIEIPSGEPLFLVPLNMAKKYDERCVTYAWPSNRELFGYVFRLLLPDYSYAMPQDSGVMIGSFISTASIVPDLTFPGDIDVLIIPYEGDELVLSHTLAIEIKVIRASFAQQGKSPNQFGFSQASALLAAGFPHAAVGHLVVSDRSPKDAWREKHITKIIDANTGACEPLQAVMVDMLPSDLLGRSYGRLKHNLPDESLGFFSAYPFSKGIWFPTGECASFNPRTSSRVLDGIYAYYKKHHQHFLRTRSHPPPDPIIISESERQRLFTIMLEKMRRDFP